MIKKLINNIRKFFFDFVFFALYATFLWVFARGLFEIILDSKGYGWPDALWVMPIMWFFLMAARWFYKKTGSESKSGNGNGGNNNHRRFRR